MSRGSDRSNVTTDRNIIHSLEVNALPIRSFKINCEYGVAHRESVA